MTYVLNVSRDSTIKTSTGSYVIEEKNQNYAQVTNWQILLFLNVKQVLSLMHFFVSCSFLLNTHDVSSATCGFIRKSCHNSETLLAKSWLNRS